MNRLKNIQTVFFNIQKSESDLSDHLQLEFLQNIIYLFIHHKSRNNEGQCGYPCQNIFANNSCISNFFDTYIFINSLISYSSLLKRTFIYQFK